MAYKGKFRVTKPEKYDGDHTKVTYRSGWERQVMVWFEANPAVVKWSSEETIIPYICKTDGKPHRYFMDFKVTFSNGTTYLIEVKPDGQTKPPKTPTKKTRRYINEVMTYAKNISKWETAKVYADDRNYIFEVWTEKTLKSLGIKILGK